MWFFLSVFILLLILLIAFITSFIIYFKKYNNCSSHISDLTSTVDKTLSDLSICIDSKKNYCNKHFFALSKLLSLFTSYVYSNTISSPPYVFSLQSSLYRTNVDKSSVIFYPSPNSPSSLILSDISSTLSFCNSHSDCIGFLQSFHGIVNDPSSFSKVFIPVKHNIDNLIIDKPIAPSLFLSSPDIAIFYKKSSL
jgi:hypothetical protein